MPPRKPVKPLRLQELCIQLIIRNIDVYRMKEIRSLPTLLLEELIKFTHDKNETLVIDNKVEKLSIHYKIKMISENITTLSFSLWTRTLNRVNIKYVLNSIPKHFKNLKQFHCEGELTHREILNLVHSFPNIIDLELRCTRVNDDILEAIGDNCPNLERLNLIFGDITDVGLSRLCNCSNITHLRLGVSSYTIKGCLIVLQSLKQLKVFDIWCLIKAFVKLFQDLNGSQELPTFQLCKLREIYMDDLPMGFFNFLTKCCPNVSNLNLRVSNNISNYLMELKKCEKILSLEICISKEEFPISHLTDVGYKVTNLCIVSSSVDFESIGYNCPNLKVLELRATVRYQPIVKLKRENCVKPFRKLQKLYLNAPGVFSTHIPQMKFLFQNCVELEHLVLEHSIREGDVDDFFRIIEINPLSQLSHLTINDSSSTVCKLVILQFLKMENNLLYVSTDLGRYPPSPNDKREIESYIKENNLSTHLEICSKFITFCN